MGEPLVRGKLSTVLLRSTPEECVRPLFVREALCFDKCNLRIIRYVCMYNETIPSDLFKKIYVTAGSRLREKKSAAKLEAVNA